MVTPHMSQRKQVVIIGGGFGGLNAASGLDGADVDVTVVDRENHHLFQPLLYQVATGALSPGGVASPLRGVLKRHPNATVEAYDIARKGIVEVMLVFTHAGAQQRPRVEFKRQSKSAATMRAQRFGPDGDKLGFGREGSVTITSTQHFLRRHFVQL